MIAKVFKLLSITVLTGSLIACAGFFDKDNTPTPSPLASFNAEVKPRLLFSTRTGSGASDEYLKLTPAIAGNAVYTSSINGVVAAVNKTTGQLFWRTDTHLPLNAGPGAGDGIVVVGARHGEVVALSQIDGRQLWRNNVNAEILAAPAVSGNKVIVKATDGTVHGLEANNGRHLWTYQQTEPNLILRGASSPRTQGSYAFIGFANGNLIKLGMHNGQAYWSHAISTAQGAFAIQRMIDIDADPVISGHRIFAATYQGHITSLAWNSGDVLWSHDISSYTGMTASNETVYISDAISHVWAFGADNGLVNWRQTKLQSRNISGPAAMGNYVVVGDAQGYLHWLHKADGHFAAREQAGSAVYATPLVDNGILYVYTSKGNLLAYTLS